VKPPSLVREFNLLWFLSRRVRESSTFLASPRRDYIRGPGLGGSDVREVFQGTAVRMAGTTRGQERKTMQIKCQVVSEENPEEEAHISLEPNQTRPIASPPAY
jgi:hypothetical protein